MWKQSSRFNSRFFYYFLIWSQFYKNKYSLWKCQCIFFTCTKQKKLLNLQVEIILGICCFPKVDSVFTFDFFFQYNLVYFDFVRTSNSPKICVWYHCIKFLFERVWWEFCLILFSVILSTPGTHMYCNYLLTTKVTALRSY